MPRAPKSGKCSGIFTDLVPQGLQNSRFLTWYPTIKGSLWLGVSTLRHKSAPARSVRTLRKSRTSCAPCVGEKFYPSRLGGRKIWKTSLRFPNYWAGGKTSPPRPPLHAHCVSRETPVLRVTLTDAIPVPASVEPRFYPSGCGGHKNLENVATFSKFLGGRKTQTPRGAFLGVSRGVNHIK